MGFRIILTLIASLACGAEAAFPCYEGEPDTECVYRFGEKQIHKLDVTDSVFEEDVGYGTAILLSSGQYLTNRHVVDHDEDIEPAFWLNGRELQIVDLSEDSDLALVESNLWPNTDELADWATQEPRGGARVYSVGWPSGFALIVQEGLYHTNMEGNLTSTAQIYPGNSGGALVQVKDGEVQILGVTTQGLHTQGNFTNVSWSIPAEDVLNFLLEADDGW